LIFDIENHESLRIAALLLQLAEQGEKDLEEGRILPQEQALERVRSRIESRR
jgi:hypothetical protein